MRITVRGLLIVSFVLIFTTTTLLWQCRPPAATRNPPSFEELHHKRHVSKSNGRDELKQDGPGDDSSYFEELADPAETDEPFDEQQQLPNLGENSKDASLSEIPCIINDGITISCRKEDSEVYIPFSFIHNYFEIYGRLTVGSHGNEVFEWSHSYSRFYEPSSPYDPIGRFLNFDQFNVEARERVKCISAINGVPISTQWEVSGYAYPIQIAQFGLSHYSRFLKEKKSKRVILEDGLRHKAKWKADDSSSISRSFDQSTNSQVLHFMSPESLLSNGVTLKLHEITDLPNLLVISLNLKLPSGSNSSFSLTLQTQDNKFEIIYIHYVCSNQLVETQDRHIYYGLGNCKGWKRLTRNFMVDLLKGIAAATPSKKARAHIAKGTVKLLSLELRGSGKLSDLTISSAEHLHHFYDSADWLVKNQDVQGGWSIPVRRKVISGLLEVDAGWYSAMAQGQAISLLVRAAHHSGDLKYLVTASKATDLFSVNSTKGGVLTYFPGGFPWYEEYPTSPSLFVLNGFMYSLLGLYDLKQMKTAPKNPSSKLFESGMKSLKRLLPLFDSGWSSFYDLRHFTVHVPPNLARWDYHTTHITQLLAFATIEKEENNIIKTTAERWKEYMVGKRSKHN